ncbi:MAG: hypothetical protein DPW16_09805 [Chloroflexi bacterium]|nr:hypothetical protein [Chloroflexota bacterium]
MLTKQNSKTAAVLIFAVIAAIAIAILVPSLFSDSSKPNDENIKSHVVESDDDVVERIGNWTLQTSNSASGGSYLSSSGSPDDTLILTFVGSQVEVVSVAEENQAPIILDIDGRAVQTSKDQQRTVLDDLEDGLHTMRVSAQDGGVIGVDAFEVLTDSEQVVIVNENKIVDGVFELARTEGRICVDVVLQDPQPNLGQIPGERRDIKLIAQVQDDFMADIQPGIFEVLIQYTIVPGFTGYADLDAIIEIQSNPLVTHINVSCVPIYPESAWNGRPQVFMINKAKLYPRQLLEIARKHGKVCVSVALAEPQPMDTLPPGQLPDPELIRQVQDKVLDGIKNGRFELTNRLTAVAGFGGYATYGVLLDLQAMPEVIRIDMCMQGHFEA